MAQPDSSFSHMVAPIYKPLATTHPRHSSNGHFFFHTFILTRAFIHPIARLAQPIPLGFQFFSNFPFGGGFPFPWGVRPFVFHSLVGVGSQATFWGILGWGFHPAQVWVGGFRAFPEPHGPIFLFQPGFGFHPTRPEANFITFVFTATLGGPTFLFHVGTFFRDRGLTFLSTGVFTFCPLFYGGLISFTFPRLLKGQAFPYMCFRPFPGVLGGLFDNFFP